jgi:hypothetical protein
MFTHQSITTPIYTPTNHGTPLTYTTHTVTTTPTSTIYHNYLTNDFNDFYNDYGVSYVYIEPKKITNIPYIGNKKIPKGSYDIITYERINDKDILIDFKRDHKTEYEYNTFYKESNLDNIIKSGKNQFTMLSIDYSSVVKYTAELN